MKVVTPEISWHGKEPIYSIDFQPGDRTIQRLASASVDKLIRMWQVKVDKEGKVETEFLSNLRRHTRSVNVCRFSPDGDTLASAGDDNVILFWRLSDTPTPANNIFQEEDEDNKETWVASTTLRGHLEDVYDLCWSADGRYLISGSVDNSAILWDTSKDSKLALFNDHKSFVQGVALDPLNEFAATLSCDRSLRVYSMTGKTCVNNVSKMIIPSTTPDPEVKQKPFRMYHDDTMGSFFRRLAFSPDGQFLITPAGCVEQGDKVTNATFIFTRNCLSKPAMYLQSPQKPTVAVRPCPQLFELRKVDNTNIKDQENNNLKEWEKYSTLFCLPYRVVFAVVSEDAVLLYDTQQTTPIAYISNTHYLQMTDITWSSNGQILVASSSDGFCTLVTFEEGELGIPYVPEEKQTEVKDSESSSDAPSVDLKSESHLRNETAVMMAPPAISPDKLKTSPDEAAMEVDTGSEDLILILDETTNDASGSDKSHCSDTSKSGEAQKRGETDATNKKTKDEAPSTSSNISVKPTSTEMKCPENESGLTVKPISGSSTTAGSKPKRIQFQTISLLKPK
ncbi:chromatin assembly factor 1 subunit B-like [Haliotis asinina]|uniref:chromatin assembly factor 1 subunit B-like n=1 Tax=Haliotis asinina TaxID=109174 RepID=UPI003531D394